MAELLVKVTDDQAARSALEEQYILGYRNAHGLELLHSVPYLLIRVCFSFASPRSVIGQQNLRQFSTSEKQMHSRLPRTRFPALDPSFMYFLRVPIGSLERFSIAYT